MAKAEKPKVKAKVKPKFTDKEQSERFIKAAREIGAEDSAAFEQAVDKIVRYRDAPNAKT